MRHHRLTAAVRLICLAICLSVLLSYAKTLKVDNGELHGLLYSRQDQKAVYCLLFTGTKAKLVQSIQQTSGCRTGSRFWRESECSQV